MTAAAAKPKLPPRPDPAASPETVRQWLEAADRANATLSRQTTEQAELIRVLKKQNADLRAGRPPAAAPPYRKDPDFP